jgi:hypothetical protein
MAMLDGAVWSLIKSDLNLLAKQIVENDPKDENIRLEAELSNIEAIEKDIRDKLKRENSRYSIFVENPDAVESDYFETYEAKIKMFNKKLAQINNEKAKIKTLQTIKQEQLNNIDFVISSNLSAIEKSKDLLKKYINIFVDDIRLHYHNTRFTIISINFKKYGYDQMKKVSNGRAEFTDASYTKCTYVILDKKQTLKIRAVKTNLPISVLEQNLIKVMRFDVPLEKIFEKQDEKIENRGVIKEFKEIKFSKLDVYKNV